MRNLTKILHLGSTITRLKLNKIGGNLFERWNMWFNAIIHAKPYQHLKWFLIHFICINIWNYLVLHGCRQFVFWDVKFSFIYERNSINKCYYLNFFIYMTEVKSLWSLYVGLHTCYKGKNKELLKNNLKLISKNYLSSDCSLKFENMKSKSLVIVKSMLRWIISQILHTPPITLEKFLGLENIKIFHPIFIFYIDRFNSDLSEVDTRYW